MPKKPGLKKRTVAPCGPVDVAAVWKRIGACVGKLVPPRAGRLADGATEKQVAAFEKKLGRALPDDVRGSFLAHDGERGGWEHPVFGGLDFLSLRRAAGVWKDWSALVDDEDLNEFARESGRSTPRGAIRLGYANLNWIPLVDVGGSGYFGVDLDPGKQGWPGQVINFGRDEEYKVVVAWSWGWFLSDLADELEAGNFRYSADEDRRGLILVNPAPDNGSLYNVMTEWSRAKLPRRPFDPLAPEALAALRADRTVVQLARGIATKRDWGALPVLADALEESGCADARLLAHLRQPGEHGCGCWAVNLLLGAAALS